MAHLPDVLGEGGECPAHVEEGERQGDHVHLLHGVRARACDVSLNTKHTVPSEFWDPFAYLGFSFCNLLATPLFMWATDSWYVWKNFFKQSVRERKEACFPWQLPRRKKKRFSPTLGLFQMRQKYPRLNGTPYEKNWSILHQRQVSMRNAMK